jgi:hypothetical protein
MGVKKQDSVAKTGRDMIGRFEFHHLAGIHGGQGKE